MEGDKGYQKASKEYIWEKLMLENNIANIVQ